MYLPVDVLLDEPPVAAVVEQNPPESQHPLVNYQHQQPHPPTDQYINRHPANSYFFQTPHHFLASANQGGNPSMQNVSLNEPDEHRVFHHCDFEQEKKQLQQHLQSHQQQLAPCAECGQMIKDRFYLLVAERCWHVDCLRCSVCKLKLETQLTCFAREGTIYCKDDYHQRFCKRCARCNRIISSKELVMRAKEFIFHLHCFNCVVCSCPLQPGDYFALAPTGLLYCQNHYEPLFYGSGTVPVIPQPTSPSESDVIDIGNRNLNFRLMTSSPSSSNKSACADTSDMGNSKSPGRGGQKGRPKKRKGLNNDQQQLTVGCSLPTSETLLGHQSILHQTGIRSDPNLIGGGLLPQSGQNVSQGQLVHSARSSPSSGTGSGIQQQQQTRSKRMRTSFKHHQLRTMKAYFTLNHNPDAKDLKQLAQKTGLTKRVLQVWFQNARAKYRRSMQGKQPDSQNPTTPGPAGVSGASAGGGSSSDIGENTNFAIDPDDQSMGPVLSRRSSDASNESTDFSHASAGEVRSNFNEENYARMHKNPTSPEYSPTAGPRSVVLPPNITVPITQSQECFSGQQHAHEEDSASRSLADYFQQVQSGLL